MLVWLLICLQCLGFRFRKKESSQDTQIHMAPVPVILGCLYAYTQVPFKNTPVDLSGLNTLRQVRDSDPMVVTGV